MGSEDVGILVAGFEDPEVAGVSVCQKVQASTNQNDNLTVWESFGALDLVSRNILHCSLAYFNDGQAMNLSGKTVAHR